MARVGVTLSASVYERSHAVSFAGTLLCTPTWLPSTACGVASLMQFLKKTMGVTEDDPQKDLKDELKHLFAKLCGKLDALCNFHYTPKAVIPEMKVGQSEQRRWP